MKADGKLMWLATAFLCGPHLVLAAPTELTETAQFLASDAASFMTGQIVTVDGGRTLLDSVAAPVH